MNVSSISNQPLYINGRFLTQPVSGVQAFARSICSELIENKVNIKIVVPDQALIDEQHYEAHLIRSGKQTGHLWEQFHLAAFMKQHPGSVLLNLCNTGPLNFKNQAVTIHDLAFVVFPKWFHPAFRIWYNFMVPKLVTKSKHIFTVSEAVKHELFSCFKQSESKTSVISNKVSTDFLTATEQPPSGIKVEPHSFFLMVGSDDPRKNFEFVEKMRIKRA